MGKEEQDLGDETYKKALATFYMSSPDFQQVSLVVGVFLCQLIISGRYEEAEKYLSGVMSHYKEELAERKPESTTKFFH